MMSKAMFAFTISLLTSGAFGCTSETDSDTRLENYQAQADETSDQICSDLCNVTALCLPVEDPDEGRSECLELCEGKMPSCSEEERALALTCGALSDCSDIAATADGEADEEAEFNCLVNTCTTLTQQCQVLTEETSCVPEVEVPAVDDATLCTNLCNVTALCVPVEDPAEAKSECLELCEIKMPSCNEEERALALNCGGLSDCSDIDAAADEEAEFECLVDTCTALTEQCQVLAEETSCVPE